MLQNNPWVIEKLVQAKQEDIFREIRNNNEHELKNANEPLIKIVMKSRVLRGASLMILLVWLFSVIN